jgi:heptosyltransferase-2
MLAPFDDVLAIAGDGLAGIAASGLRALRELRRRQVDVVVDIEYFSKLSSVFCALSGARYRLGFRLPARWRQRLLDGGIAFREDLHFSACVARLLHRLGVDYRNLPAEGIRVPKAAGHAAEALLATDVPAGVCAWIAVNPHANELCVQRRWPLERFADVIAGLLKSRPDLGALVPGMQAERPVAERLRDLVDPAFRPRVRVIAGETALPTLAALLRRVRLTLTNDSGIMHLAAAAGSPLVALFGPESPVRYGPSGASHGIRVLSGDVPCGPCLSYMNHKRAPCGDAPAACMLQIQAGEVRRACEELLENGHGVA